MITAAWVEKNYFPPPSANPDPYKLRQHIDDFLLYQHELRARDVRTDRKGELYDAGVQWLWRAQAGGDIGTLYTQWVPVYWSDPNDPNYLPTPVFNEGFRPRQNESSRLARPEYKPRIVPRGDPNDFTAKIGAKTMERSTLYNLERMEWDKQEELMYYHMPVYGGVWLKSEWVMSWDKVSFAPSPVALACPGCSLRLSSPLMSKDQIGALAGSVGGPPPIPTLDEGQGGGAWDRLVASMRRQMGLTTGMMEETRNEPGLGVTPPVFAENAFQPTRNPNVMRATNCPFCNDHHQLQPFQPTLQEAATSADSIGRPMGKPVALGDWWASVRPSYDMFPKDLGLNTRQGFINEWVEAHVETLDWIALRWPDKVNEVEPERPERLTEFHPVAGAPDLYAGMYQGKLFKNSTRVKEYHRQPSMYPYVSGDGSITWKYDKGRSCVMAGDVVLLDSEMMLPSSNNEGQFVERCIVDYIPWEIRDGGRRLKGLSLWELMFDPQDTVNLGKSQTQAVQERLAVPFYIASRQHNIQSVTKRSGSPGLWVELDIDPIAPSFVPQLLNNETIDQGVAVATAAAQDFLQRVAGLTEVEQGQTPPNVSAAYAIQQLKIASGEGRAPRIRRIKEGLKKIWSHGTRLQAAFYSPLERREIRYHDDATDEDVWSTVSALDFQGQTDVEVDGEPDLDEEAEVGERIRDAVQLKVLNPASSPQMTRNVARLMKLPKELYEDENMQEAAAQREFLGFRDNGKVPVVDPSLDDNEAHYQVHGRSAHSPWFRQMEVLAGWDPVLLILGADWDTSLKALLSSPPFDAQVLQQYMQVVQQAQMIGQQPPPPPPPDTLQVRILRLWQQKLQMAQYTPQNPDALNRVMNWRAHMEAHKLMAEQRAIQAASPAPPMAAPGAPAAPGGMQAGPGAPAMTPPQPEMATA